MPFRVFSASIRTDHSVLRLPVAIHNTGASPQVVVDLRVDLSSHGKTTTAASRSYRRTIKPAKDDVEDFPYPYVIPGRTVVTRFVEFTADPSVMATGKPALATISALGRSGRWRHVGSFEIRTDAIGDPGAYITYSNDPTHWPPGQLDRAAKSLARLRSEIQTEGIKM